MKVFNCSQPSQGPQAFEQQTSNSQAVGVSSRLSWRPKAAGEQGRQVDEDVIFVNLTSLLTPAGRYHQRRPRFSFCFRDFGIPVNGRACAGVLSGSAPLPGALARLSGAGDQRQQVSRDVKSTKMSSSST